MSANSTVTGCEWEFIGQGYDPVEANELCAGEEGSGPDGEKEPAEDPLWEYGYG
jgi:hypothetical protein